jgi:hypothetical protein
VTCVCVVVDTVVVRRAGAGTLAVVRIVRTVRVLVVVALGDDAVVVVCAAVVLESLAAGGGFAAVAGGASTGGGAVGVVTGAGSVGCVAWASKGVEESARAAAIAGRALDRAYRVLLIIMNHNNARARGWHGYRSAEPEGR